MVVVEEKNNFLKYPFDMTGDPINKSVLTIDALYFSRIVSFFSPCQSFWWKI